MVSRWDGKFGSTLAVLDFAISPGGITFCCAIFPPAKVILYLSATAMAPFATYSCCCLFSASTNPLLITRLLVRVSLRSLLPLNKSSSVWPLISSWNGMVARFWLSASKWLTGSASHTYSTAPVPALVTMLANLKGINFSFILDASDLLLSIVTESVADLEVTSLPSSS